ncbi:MAG: hypothetical protein M1825_005533 [Sarcosagium campestre]|nr:MAG: hypothetical protein M1825_005533 [Sarcosagium campestre]
MAPLKKRRRIDSDALHGKYKKKHQSGAAIYDASEMRSRATVPERQVVAVENLAWSEVAMPDRIGDMEGFYGLEEIENVEVLQHEGGRLEFRAVEKKSASAQGRKYSQFTSEGDEHILADDQEGLWEGLDEAADILPAHTAPVQEVKCTKKIKAAKAKSANAKKGAQSSIKGSHNSFASLGDEDTEDGVSVSAWEDMSLSAQTLAALSRLAFSRPTPIQRAAIPEILTGRDLVGKAPTGSGKTLAFGIPILEHFLEKSSRASPARTDLTPTIGLKIPTALILSPTRELAHQLNKHLNALCSDLASESPSIVTVTGGLSVQKQHRQLEGADLIIGTPGRLWEIISGGHGLVKSLKKIKFLVIDEADRLLSEGHFQEFEQILSILDDDDEKEVGSSSDSGTEDTSPGHQRQTLVFSATFQKDLLQKLSGKMRSRSDKLGEQASMEYLLKKLNFREKHPKFVDVNPVSQMAERLDEALVECAALEKDLYLYGLLLYHRRSRILVFTNSISSVRRLTPFLQALNLPAHSLHSQMPQKARLRSIERFAAPGNSQSILIATDVAARGLDISGVNLVLHYHVPRAADMYVHRSGRTARATRSGSSILICAPDEVLGVRRLVAKVHARDGIAKNGGSNMTKHFIRSLELDRRVIARLKPRVTIAKKISDSLLAKEKKRSEGDWLRTAAGELGVDYDSNEFEAAEDSGKGRGTGRRKAAREARSLTGSELAQLKAELKASLAQRINVGVSERYPTAGRINVQELLDGGSREFLGDYTEI